MTLNELIKYICIVGTVCTICTTGYTIADRICDTVDRENSAAYTFRALELGYDGKIDTDKLFGD